MPTLSNRISEMVMVTARMRYRMPVGEVAITALAGTGRIVAALHNAPRIQAAKV